MKAKALLEGQLLGYSPTSALANSQAFEQAWFMIAGRYSEEEAAEKAQLLLAESVFSVSTHTDTDVRRIIISALTMLRAEERRRHLVSYARTR